jgi:N-acetylneuraminic acid mutarotase
MRLFMAAIMDQDPPMRCACFAIVLVGCGGSPAPGDDADIPSACEATTPWASAPPLAIGPTQETAVVAVGGQVFILGGFNNGDIVTTVQLFDPVSCTYSTAPPLPAPVHHVTAAALGNTIFVLGALTSGSFTAIGDTWSWTPGDASWQVRATMPVGTQRGAAVAGAVGDKLVVAGGFRNGAVTDVGIYDPVGDAWTAGPPLPAPRDHACGGVIGDKLYVAGGRQGDPSTNAPTLFELALGGAWVERAVMPTARGGTACGVVGDRLIVVGGEGNPNEATGVFPEVEAYTAASDTWDALAPMPTPRHGMGAAAVGGRLYVPGGATTQGFGAVATHEILTP